MGANSHTHFHPTNSDDGLSFMENWCMRCKKEQWLRDQENDDAEKCEILTEAMTEATYNKPVREWIVSKESGLPYCTAFEAENEFTK